MGNEIETKNGNNLIEFSTEEKNVIMRQFFPQGSNPAEMAYCMSVAKNMGLNPILGQIYFVPRRSKIDGKWHEKLQPLAGRDAFLSLAHRSKQFAGIKSKSEIRETPRLENEEWVMKKDLVATAEVLRKDSSEPFIVEVCYSEYVQTNKYGVNSFWKDKPDTMLKKVAESQALRKAFNISGLFDETEIDVTSTQYEEKAEETQIDTSLMKVGVKSNDVPNEVPEIQDNYEDTEVIY